MRSIGHAHWHDHANGVNPPDSMRGWLTDRRSLTVKLVERSRQFRVQKLHQAGGLSLPDESGALGVPQRTRVREREVLLRCDELPVVFAHTIVPLDATASDWPFFNALGERSLGTTLFGDPMVQRGALQFARLRAQHPLARRAHAAAGTVVEAGGGALFARRCLFRRKSGLLLVTEVFLPSIAAVNVPNKLPAESPTANNDLSIAARIAAEPLAA